MYLCISNIKLRNVYANYVRIKILTKPKVIIQGSILLLRRSWSGSTHHKRPGSIKEGCEFLTILLQTHTVPSHQYAGNQYHQANQ